MKIVYRRKQGHHGRAAAVIEAAQRGGSQFASSEFGQAVSGVYRQGAGIFAAVDIGAIFRDEQRKAGAGIRTRRKRRT